MDAPDSQDPPATETFFSELMVECRSEHVAEVMAALPIPFAVDEQPDGVCRLTTGPITGRVWTPEVDLLQRLERTGLVLHWQASYAPPPHADGRPRRTSELWAYLPQGTSMVWSHTHFGTYKPRS